MPTRPRDAVLLVLLAAAAAQADCPPQPPRVLLERFVAAPCVGCWKKQPPLQQELRGAWVLDWVVPAPPGTPPPDTPRQAFLHGAALPESAARMARLGGPLAPDEAFTLSHPLPQRSALALQVRDTRLPGGKIGLQLEARFTSQRPLPAGLQGWLAVVERLPPGDESSPVGRQVVRALVGPLRLEGLARQPITHLRTVDPPAQGDPQQFTSIGWVETTRGRVIAVGRGVLADCPKD